MSNVDTCSEAAFGPSLAEFCSASTFVAFATILNSLLRSNNVISGVCERVQSVDPEFEYDFVVIGSGAAGAVVATRLSEVPEWKVLLIENGPDEPVAAEVPMLAGTLRSKRVNDKVCELVNSMKVTARPIEKHPYCIGSKTIVDWNYSTTNETHGCLASNGSCTIASGNMLGGSTSHNGMLYLRGTPADFDGWAALGNDGWSWDDVFPFFKKSEDNREIERVGTKYHSTGGPQSVERLPYVAPLGYSILAASGEAGLGISEDLNGDNITGFAYMQTTSKHGVRRSSAAAFLRPVRNRTNLHISLNTTGTKVIVENGVAVGVQYYKNGEFKTVNVSKEVVVSAGSIGSPKLLLLSGIGPREQLESVGVDVVHELPGVGENFHDHIGFSVSYSLNDVNFYDYNQAVADQYLANQTGPLSGNGVGAMRGRIATNLTTPDNPDIRVGFSAYTTTCAPAEAQLKSTAQMTTRLNVINLHPKSRGRVSLASKEPLDYPVIWGNYLGEPIDVERLIQGLELAMPLADTEALRAWNLTLTTTPLAACSNYTFASREYWTCAIRQRASSDYHAAGTCKMGNSSDSMAVVDSTLRVHGITGLRVADASIMPKVTSGNTAAPTMMIGERAADFIKEYWNKNSCTD